MLNVAVCLVVMLPSIVPFIVHKNKKQLQHLLCRKMNIDLSTTVSLCGASAAPFCFASLLVGFYYQHLVCGYVSSQWKYSIFHYFGLCFIVVHMM